MKKNKVNFLVLIMAWCVCLSTQQMYAMSIAARRIGPSIAKMFPRLFSSVKGVSLVGPKEEVDKAIGQLQELQNLPGKVKKISGLIGGAAGAGMGGAATAFVMDKKQTAAIAAMTAAQQETTAQMIVEMGKQQTAAIAAATAAQQATTQALTEELTLIAAAQKEAMEKKAAEVLAQEVAPKTTPEGIFAPAYSFVRTAIDQHPLLYSGIGVGAIVGMVGIWYLLQPRLNVVGLEAIVRGILDAPEKQSASTLEKNKRRALAYVGKNPQLKADVEEFFKELQTTGVRGGHNSDGTGQLIITSQARIQAATIINRIHGAA